MDFNPLSSIGALWQKPLNYANTIRVNNGAKEALRTNAVALETKTKIIASERYQTYSAKIDAKVKAKADDAAFVVQESKTHTHTSVVNSYEQAVNDFGLSERAAHTFAAVRNDMYAERYGIAEEDRISVEVAKVFAQTTDAFLKEFADNQNLPEATMLGLSALNFSLPIYFPNDSSFGIPVESYYGNLKGENKPTRAIPTPPSIANIADVLRARIQNVGYGNPDFLEFFRPYEGESDEHFAQRVEGRRLRYELEKRLIAAYDEAIAASPEKADLFNIKFANSWVKL
ncbi:MAG: hypothetical protein LBP89_04300 [Helicobacteraceae bacterium]|jgi:hypothetical protein|nr:hypothetical protein [Helicobacteraceae bacterium]